MRFKKLRLSVGIALILFILIAGNIIVFGKLIDKDSIFQLNNPDNDDILVDPKQMVPEGIQTETKPTQPEDDVQNNPPPAPPIVHHNRRRTRAS